MKRTKIYAESLEDTALKQFEDAMSQPFAISGALMPDAHTGYSLPIGAVVATDGVVAPAWVGYDIGCGMCAVKIGGVSKDDIVKNNKEIFDLIYKRIPVGFNANTTHTPYELTGLTEKGREIAERKKYSLALGSLGGGNHFIEIGSDENDNIWVVIHSGSRGVGHGIASHYMTIASSNPSELEKEFDNTHKDLLKHNPDKYEFHKSQWVSKKIGRLRPKEGHYGFDVNSQEGKDYIQDLNWCLDYAIANREVMLFSVADVLIDILRPSVGSLLPLKVINRNHNHAVEKDGLWIHRKGATHAEEGMMGVIPGNMKDGSFIVRGKGNKDSLCSSSHGAGRVMGRRQAKDVLNLKEFEKSMEGITALVDDSTLDESPLAYKDINKVMRLQSDLVEIVAHITPIVNIKG